MVYYSILPVAISASTSFVEAYLSTKREHIAKEKLTLNDIIIKEKQRLSCEYCGRLQTNSTNCEGCGAPK